MLRGEGRYGSSVFTVQKLYGMSMVTRKELSHGPRKGQREQKKEGEKEQFKV